MRVAFVVGVLVASGVLAGCVNPDPDDPERPGASLSTNSQPLVPTVLAPLSTAITTAAPKWLAPGTSIEVAASAPANARGTVAYAWAIGVLPGTVVTNATYDTGSKSPKDYVAAGASKSIKFATAGLYEMHCHPHPWMRSNVTVIDGYQGPASVEVKIVDGEKAGEFRYVPENVVIGVGATVVYNNTGKQPHTATILQGEPALKLLPLKSAAGNVTIEGSGWMRLRVITVDADGRIGNATHDLYVAPLPAFTQLKKQCSFPVGGLPEVAVSPCTDSFSIEHSGTVTFNFTAKDALAQNGAPVNLALVDVHLKEQGETQDAATATGKDAGTLVAKGPGGTYSLLIAPMQGISLIVDYTIDVAYDAATPPAPVMAGGGGEHHH